MGISEFALSIAEYRDGDILALSGIIEVLQSYAASEQPQSLRCRIATKIAQYLELRFKDGRNLERVFLSDSVDILSRLERFGQKTDTEAIQDVKDTIEAWKTKHALCLRELQSANSPEKTATTILVPRESVPSVPSNGLRSKAAQVLTAPPPVLSKLDHSVIGSFLNQEVFQAFLLEASERLATTQDSLLKLEAGVRDDELIQDIFRVFHTFKGECGFFKLVSMGELAHQYESMLDLIRDKTLEVSPRVIATLFKGVDTFREMLDSLKRQDIAIFNTIDCDELLQDIQAINSSIHIPVGERLVRNGTITDAERNHVLQEQKIGNFQKPFGEIAVEKGILPQFDEEVLRTKAQNGAQSTPLFSDQYVKVKASDINYLVDMIGELMIAQNQLAFDDQVLAPFRKITREIQTSALRLRTTKLKLLMINMHRGLRDISSKLGKEVQFQSFGEDQEVDRSLVESLSEPLLHMIRNSVHHGIESPEERVAMGKNPTATVTLGAERRGNTIVISVAEDGRGLDRDRILQRALARGLVTNERVATITDTEIWNFIFLAGFSTAETVGQISGRGVGMDIVKNFVITNRGRIEINTAPGTGTRFDLYFPVNTAIVDGLVVAVGSLSLVLPVSQVIETLDLSEETVHPVNGAVDILNLRGRMLPVIDLRGYFGEPDGVAATMGVVVEDSISRRFLFAVDAVVGKNEVVIKSFGSRFADLKAINSGTALQGGKIGYIVDVDFIINDQKVAKEQSWNMSGVEQ